MTHAPVLVFGAGGHGRVVAEVVQASGHRVAGFVDDGVERGTLVLGLPVLGGMTWLAEQPPHPVALGLGDNRRRETVSATILGQGHSLPPFVHPTAVISPTARLGDGTVAMARVVLNAQATIGRGVILNTGCIVEHKCIVSDFAHLSPGSVLGGGAVVGRRTHVGIGATVLHLATIGDDCVIGGGAVVLKRVESGVTVVGVPARPVAPRR